MHDSSLGSEQPRSKRVPRSDKGHPQLTRRDLDLLRLIGEQTAYRYDQLQGWLARHPDSQSADPAFLSESRTSALIRRLQRLDLLIYRKLLYDEPGWVYLSAKGLYHAQLPCRFHEPSLADLEHLFWVNETRALVQQTLGTWSGFRWESERLLRATRERLQAQQKQEPELVLPYEYQGKHRPDALLRHRASVEADAPELVCAIETELHRKSYQAWKQIFLDLLTFYPYARYYVAPSIKDAFQSALERFQTEEPDYGEPDRKRRQFILIHDLERILSSPA